MNWATVVLQWELQKEAEYKFYRKNFGDDWNNLNSYSFRWVH